MPGPPAKHPSARRRANRKRTARQLEAPAEPQGPFLPDEYVVCMTEAGPFTRAYGERTQRWWSRIQQSPHASAYEDLHWEWLLALAPLFDRWVELGDLDALKELRLQAPPFGLRPADANRLDWTIDPKITGPGRQHDDQDDDEIEEPPRSGKGSGVAAWREYAIEVLELDVPKRATRTEIIKLVDERKHGRPSRIDPRLVVHEGGAAATGA